MKIKKLFALLLVCIMLFALASTAFADTTTGTINISSPVVGETYKIYKMFDLESYDPTNGTYSYTIKTSSPWYAFVSGSGAGASYVTLTAYDSTTYYVTWTDDSADKAAFAKLALAYAQDTNNGVSSAGNGKVTADTSGNKSLDDDTKSDNASYTNDTLSFSDLDLGYYLVDSSLGALVMLNTTDDTATINEKNSAPSVTKEVEENSTNNYGASNTAGISDVVNFKTTITVGSGAQNYILHDTMSTGLTFEATTVKVYKGNVATGNEVDAANYTLKWNDTTPDTTVVTPTDANCTFEIEFTQTFLDTLSNTDTLIVTYSATVNSSAVIDGDTTSNNTNVTYLTYGDGSETTSSTTTTNVYDVDIFKYTTVTTSETDPDSGNPVTCEKALSGAQFVLYKTVKENGTDVNYYAVVANGKLTGWTKNSKSTRTEDPTDNNYATTLTSDQNGKIAVDGLDAGTYYLKETEAPTGYNKLANPVEFTISEEGKVQQKNANLGNDTVKIENKTGSELPETGGIGTTIFYIVGGVLVVGAVIFLVVRRRMRA